MSLLKKLNNRSFLYINLVLLFFLSNFAMQDLNWRLDFSRDQRNSVSDSTRKVLERLESPVLVEAYISQNLSGQYLTVINRFIYTLQSIKSVGGDSIELRIIDPTTSEERNLAEQRRIQGVTMAQMKDAETSLTQHYFGIYIQIGEEARSLQLISQQMPGAPPQLEVDNLEYAFLKEIRSMTNPERNSGLGFIKAPGTFGAEMPQRGQMPSKDNVWGFRYLLEQDIGSITDVILSAPVPAKYDTLVLVGRAGFNELEIYYLDQFLMRGGNLLIMAGGIDFQMQGASQNPYMQQMGGSAGMGYALVPRNELDQFNSWLGRYGIMINGELLVDSQRGIPITDPLQRFASEQPYAAWHYYSKKNGNLPVDHSAFGSIEGLVFPWPSGLDIRESAQAGAEVQYTILVQSHEDSISVESQPLDFKPMYDFVSRSNVDLVGRSIPVAVLASGKFKSGFTKESLPTDIEPESFRQAQVGDSRSNLLVIGTPYLVSDVLLGGRNMDFFRINQSFLTNMLETLQGDDELIDARSRIDAIATLKVDSILVQLMLVLVQVLGIPFTLGAYGAVRLYARNRRRGLSSPKTPEGKTEETT